MKLPKLAIENFQFVLMLVLLAVLTGLVSYFTMERSEDPVVEFPIYRVLVIYPGTSPTDLEELIVDPLEDAINEVEDIEEIRANIQEGIVSLRIEASYDVDIDDKFDEVEQAINSVRGRLPSDIFLFEVEKISPQDVAILQVALVSDHASYQQIYNVAEKLEDEINKVSGVRTVDIEAYPEEEIRVSLNFQKKILNKHWS